MSVPYDKLLVSDDCATTSVRDYVESLVDTILTLFPAGAGVTVRRRITDFDLASGSVFLLGIIINELITSTMKHAFDPAGSSGFGLTLVRMLSEQLGGSYSIDSRDGGTRSVLEFRV